MKKRSILLSLLMIGLIAALITTATTAVVTDTVTSTSNVFTAGVVDLTADGGCDEDAAPYGGPCNIGVVAFNIGTGSQANLKPGASISHDFTVASDGSLPFTYAVTLTKDAGTLWTCSAAIVTATSSVTAAGADTVANAIPSSAAAQNETVRVTVSMPLAAGNTCQGVSGQLTVTFVATQS